jgi:hypothetical protein
MARFGIWHLEPSLVVPTQARWALPWTARRLVQQACDRGQTLHVAVNGELLAQNPAHGLATLEFLLKLAQAQRESQDFVLVPFGDLPAVYAPRRQRPASRSVLRAA